MLAPCHCEISGFRRSSHWPSKHLNRSGPPPPPPLHRGFSKTMQAWLQAWLREPHGVVNCWQLTTPCRPPPLRVGVRLGHRACGPTAAPLAEGERLKARGNLACGEDFHHCEKENPRANSRLQLPGSFRRFYRPIIPPLLRGFRAAAHGRIFGGAPSCPGQHPKGEAHGHTDSHSRVRVVVGGHRNRHPCEEG